MKRTYCRRGCSTEYKLFLNVQNHVLRKCRGLRLASLVSDSICLHPCSYSQDFNLRVRMYRESYYTTPGVVVGIIVGIGVAAASAFSYIFKLYANVLYVMGKALSCGLSCPRKGIVLYHLFSIFNLHTGRLQKSRRLLHCI